MLLKRAFIVNLGGTAEVDFSRLLSLVGTKVFFVNGFTQCHACVVQTTTRYAGVHKKLYKKITNRITIRMFKSIVKKER